MAAADQYTALVVEDSASMRQILVKYMQKLGFGQIFEAEHGEEAMTVLKAQRIHLVLADWNMAPMDGLALHKAMQGNVILKKIPFIMVTTNREEQKIRAAMVHGIRLYLVKPVSLQLLKSRITTAIPGITLAE